MLGLDLGARFLRGAICDLRGEIRARQDVELDGADAEGAIDAIAGLRISLAEASGLPADRIDGAVVGVPGVVDADTGRLTLATNVPGLEGRDWAEDLRTRLELTVTVENDINLAAVGERWRGMARGVEDFVFLSVGTGLGAGLVLRGELHRGRHGAAGEVDLVAAGRDEEIDPCASAISALAERLVSENGASTTLQPPYDARGIFAAARTGDEIARRVVQEEARRIALHIAPISAVTDIALVVLGGGIGVNADLLLDPIRDLLDPLATVSPARRGVEPRRRGGADGRARRRPPLGRRQRLREPRSGLLARGARPEVDVRLGGVAVDLLELVGGEVELVERRDVRLQLLDAARADQRGGDARVAQDPGDRQLRERLAAPLRRSRSAPAPSPSVCSFSWSGESERLRLAREPSGMPSR